MSVILVIHVPSIDNGDCDAMKVSLLNCFSCCE